MNAPIQLLDSAGLAARRTTNIQWLWHDYLATGMVTLLTSRGKTGKTTLLSLLLERMQNDNPLAGAPFRANQAIVVSEEPAEIWHERTATLGLHRNVRWTCRPFLNRPRPENWMDLIRTLRSEQADFVAIDTLSYFLPAGMENSADQMLAVLEPLHLLTKRGMAVLLLHHPRKGGVELSPRGSGALTAFVDILMTMDLPRNAAITDRRRILRCTSRLLGSSQRLFELSQDGLDYLPVANPPQADGFESNWEVLKTVLEDAAGEVTQKQIHQTWPEDFEAPSKATLARWLQQAVIEGKATRTGRGRANDPFRYGLAVMGLSSGNSTPVGQENRIAAGTIHDLQPQLDQPL